MKTPLFVAPVFCFLASVATAEMITVCLDGSCDFETIQAAIDYASDGDEVMVAAGVYTSRHPAHVVDMKGKAIALRSLDGPEVTFIDGEETRRGIVCFNGESKNTHISGFTIRNASNARYDYDGNGEIDPWESVGGGMGNFQSSPTLHNCTFTDNFCGIGGGMANRESNPTLHNCTFTGCTGLFGGGMANTESNPTLHNCTFTGCTGFFGGGMANDHGSPTLTNCTFNGNSAQYQSGPLAFGLGGGIYNRESSPILTSCTFENNMTAQIGGGMCNDASSPTLVSCSLNNNSAGLAGGGIYNDDSSPTLASCTFDNNSAQSNGDGIYNENSTTTLADCTFAECCQIYPVQSYNDHDGNTFANNPYEACNDCRANLDCTAGIDGADLTLLLGAWGSTEPQYDIDEDGVVDGADLAYLLAEWGPCL